jgi:hypothetical protein
MWTVKQNVFLILNSVPVTLVTYPEFIRPSVPDQKRKERKKIIKNIERKLCLKLELQVGASQSSNSRVAFQTLKYKSSHTKDIILMDKVSES